MRRLMYHAAMASRDPLHIVGTTIAEKYRIEGLVGEGGFAVVYRAQHVIWNKPVAIKFFSGLSHVPQEQRDQFQQAFIQEGALLTELSSQTAGIVQARDVATFITRDGHWMPYMVLEWLEGKTLDEALVEEAQQGRGTWNLEQVIRLLCQVCAALDVAHGKGIAHRDIKPPNLFVLGPDARAPDTVVKILDFGVAKMMSDNTELKAALARTGMSVTSFTPQYGAPEQFSRSYGATGPWTDVYALALVGVELLSGRPALDGGDVVQLGFATGNPNKRPTPKAFGIGVPDAVEAAFASALAVDPRQRFERARDFAEALRRASEGASMAVAKAVPHAAATELAPPQLSQALTGGHPPRSLEAGAGSPPIETATALTGEAGGRRKGGFAVYLSVGALAAALAGGFYFVGSGKSPPKPEGEPPFGTQESKPAEPEVPPEPPKPRCPEDMVEIPAGQYFRGSDAKTALPNEKPAHNVELDAYCFDLYEVTVKKYKECSDSGKCKRAHSEVEWPSITAKDRKVYSALCNIADPAKTDHPINCVDWAQADIYCRANGKRLPTEAEWEYATRGPDGRVYPWGDDEPTKEHLNACGTECVAWGKQNGVVLEALYDEDDGYPATAPAGRFAKGRSRFGPYDVVGNVWEWVQDFYVDYDPVDKKNPVGPETGEKKVIRGGAWNGSYATWLRPSFRYANDPKAVSHGIGFRCAKPVDG